MPAPTQKLPRTIAVTALVLLFALQLLHVAHVYSANWTEAHHLYAAAQQALQSNRAPISNKKNTPSSKKA